jgi:Domain of Unknown Function (DUF349)
VSDGPEQTTVEEVAVTEEVSATGTAVPEIAAVEVADEAAITEQAAEAEVAETPADGAEAVESPAEIVAVAAEEPLTVETPVAEAPVVEAPVVEVTAVEAPVVEATVVEVTAVETPVVEALVVETTVVEAAVVVEAPAAEALVDHAPAVESEAVHADAAEPAVVEAVAVETVVVESVVAEPSATEAEAPAEEVPVVVDLGPVSSQWGRVTEEGTVFALAADGSEREIGNWAAGSPAEGLAFYERKFASLKGEVDLLNKRVHGPGLSAKDTEAAIAKLRESLTDAHVIGDVAGLTARLDKIGRIAEQKQAAKKEARAKQQAEAAIAKEALVAEAESLADSTDWAETAQRFRNLMQQWKTAGRAQREMEDKLWDRFKAAQDTFFAARNADLNQRDAGFKENGIAKEALLVEAQKLLPVTDYKTAKAALRSIHARWETIGMVPREDKARIEGALRDIERAVADAEQAEWKRTNPEARARAQATVDQLRTSISKFEKELARASEAKQPKKVADAEAAIAARQEWLAQAQAALDEFTR